MLCVHLPEWSTAATPASPRSERPSSSRPVVSPFALESASVIPTEISATATSSPAAAAVVHVETRPVVSATFIASTSAPVATAVEATESM